MRIVAAVLLTGLSLTLSAAQNASSAGRYKADILLVVAHPDDDSAVAAYLARAIFDQQKRVAVVFCTRGDSGSNAAGREHARALGAVREMEGRRALGVLGITNVWFLDGRDTASQNVLVSLGSWPHGTVLEQTIRIMRLTRPEVVLTWLPSSVAGENHGDHQAAAVVATEAFDLAGSDTVFPAQLAAPVRSLENALEGLDAWQPKKLYYFSDAFDDGFFHGKGPEYSIKEISPSKKVSYAQFALQEFAPYYSQSPDPKLNEQIEKGENLAEVVKKATEGPDAYFSDPLRLMLGKSRVKGSPTGEVFEGIGKDALAYVPPAPPPVTKSAEVEFRLAGPWGFYHAFYRAHELAGLMDRPAEIAVNPSDTLSIPLVFANHSSAARDFTVSVKLPTGWTQKAEQTRWTVAEDASVQVAVHVVAPPQENKAFQEIQVAAKSGDQDAGTITLRVQVRTGVFAQLH